MASDNPLGDSGAVGEHLVWHQELICLGASCRGRVRRFPPGVLVEGGRRERRTCPACGVVALVPAFYLADSIGGRGDRRAAGTAPAPRGPSPGRVATTVAREVSGQVRVAPDGEPSDGSRGR